MQFFTIKSVLFLGLLCLNICSCAVHSIIKVEEGLSKIPTKEAVGAQVLANKVEPINAPFPMPQLQKPEFPNRSVSIKDKGAKEGEKVTKAIQQAIDETSQLGGGKVIIPKGRWQSGRISLKSNVDLHFEENAELYFSGAVEDISLPFSHVMKELKSCL